jgi:cell division septation protein DedD
VVGSLGLLGYLSGAGSSRFQQGSLNPAGLLKIPAYLNRSIQEVLTEKNQQKTETIRPGTAVAIASARTGTAELPRPVGVPDAVPAGVATVSVKPVVRSVAVLPVSPVTVATEPVSRSVSSKLMSHPAAHRRSLPAVRVEEPVQFSIIAGSFANRNNAVQLCRTLREAGYPDARIIQPTRRATLYKVAALSMDDQLNLAEAAEKISTLTGTPSWIFMDRR